jgi:protein TonB
MNAVVLHEFDDRAAMARWSASAAIIVALHAALIALGMAWYTHSPPPGVALPAIMVDLAPASAPSAPNVQPLDLPPGPEMREADPPPPPPEPPKQEAAQEQLAPTPPQENPIVEAPPEQKVQSPPPKPELAKIVPDQPKPVPAKPKPVRAEVRKPADAPAPRSSAAPRAERQASLAPPSAAAGAMSAAALASYNQRVAAHLQRFKQYPSAARAAGEQGTSRLSFTLGRSGQVLGSRLAGSSGHPSLDGETLAMVRRAQPFPPMPPELKQTSMSFSIPVQFSIR